LGEPYTFRCRRLLTLILGLKINMAKVASLPGDWQMQCANAVLKIAEPTLRVAIAFLLLMLFQLPGSEAQEKGRRAGEAAGQKDAFRDCADCPEMVVVPAGEFIMGSPPSERGRNTGAPSAR
jgi:formylglycine-generating enzyme required for sulfatase activity